jgi:hypothetical protein
VDAGKGDVAYGEQEGRRRCGVGVRRGHWVSWSGDVDGRRDERLEITFETRDIRDFMGFSPRTIKKFGRSSQKRNMRNLLL